MEPKSFELRQLFNELMAMFRSRVSSQVTLSLDILPDVPSHARTDERRLRQILINLIGNAIKFTKEGHVTLRVRASEGSHGSASSAWMLRLMIEDTGEGIAEEERALLFQPFSQTDSGRKLQGGQGRGCLLAKLRRRSGSLVRRALGNCGQALSRSSRVDRNHCSLGRITRSSETWLRPIWGAFGSTCVFRADSRIQ